ncbi:unnamed protein product [Owenia fusiformis]|uniref:Uncharacterized protein n=1 Tax=Owenia fusiformis TaxID=6347 RepID=A0A8J1UC11_OWEFU|nr:unnamed protein product [Owenia fusiformis]
MARVHYLTLLAFSITYVSSQVTLTVTGPTAPVKEGDTVVFTCTFVGGLPKFKIPHVIKTVDGDTGDPYPISLDTRIIVPPFGATNRYSVSFREEGNNLDIGTITITGVQGEDGGGGIGCSVPGEVSPVTVPLDVMVSPKEVYFNNVNNASSGSVIKVNEYDRVNLECHSNGSNPAPDMKIFLIENANNYLNLTESWSRRSQQPVPRYNNDGLVTILHHTWMSNIETIEYYHNRKELRCDSSVPNLPTKSASITFDVIFAPKFNCSQIQHPLSGNREAMISCPVAANPDLINDETIVQWQWTENENMQTLNPKINQEMREYRAQMMRSDQDSNVVNVYLEIRDLANSHYRTYNLYVKNNRYEATHNITLEIDRTSGTSTLSFTGYLMSIMSVLFVLTTSWV